MKHACRTRGLAVAATPAVGRAPGPLQARLNGAASDAGMMMTGGLGSEGIRRLPPVAGCAEGDRIFFIHAEASGSDIAGTLIEMMGSAVPVVLALAQWPATLRCLKSGAPSVPGSVKPAQQSVPNTARKRASTAQRLVADAPKPVARPRRSANTFRTRSSGLRVL